MFCLINFWVLREVQCAGYNLGIKTTIQFSEFSNLICFSQTSKILVLSFLYISGDLINVLSTVLHTAQHYTSMQRCHSCLGDVFVPGDDGYPAASFCQQAGHCFPNASGTPTHYCQSGHDDLQERQQLNYSYRTASRLSQMKHMRDMPASLYALRKSMV